MIVRFSVENYRSIAERQELSLVSSKIKGQDDVAYAIPKHEFSVLPVAAIYGANASGKTNVIRALEFFCSAVEDSYAEWKPTHGIRFQPFAFSEKDTKSRFQLDFLLEGELLSYGFAHDNKEVVEEWLETYPHGKKNVYFRRKGPKLTFGRTFTGARKSITAQLRPNALFLSTAAQAAHSYLTSIYRFITSIVFFINRDSAMRATQKLCTDPRVRENVTQFLVAADFGISDFTVEERELDDAGKQLAQKLLTLLPDVSQEVQNEMSKRIELRFTHKTKNGVERKFAANRESSGTLAYLSLIVPVLVTLSRGEVLLVDEIDESLHPTLSRQIVSLFNSRSSNPHGAQLIFNTHDTNILDLELLRRDEIWFTEKDHDGATHLFPLTDFMPREGENIQRGYLQGKYGAIPFLGDFRRLLEPS